jgi:hypothetical protein
MSRKLVSAIVLIMLLAPILAFSIRPARSTSVFSQNFDDETTGYIPQGWTVEDPNICSLTINDAVHYGSSGKSAKFADLTRTLFGYVGRDFEDQYGNLVFSFAVRIEVADYFDVYIDDGLGHGADVYFMSDGNIEYYDDYGWHVLCPFSINTWYKVRMFIDIPTNTYDIYIDDSPQARGIPFRGFGQATHLNRIFIGGQSYQKPVGYIDDMAVEAQERPSSPTVFSQNFDNELTGSTPEAWIVENASVCSLMVDETVHYGFSGKSAKYVDSVSYEGGRSCVGRDFENQYGPVLFSFAIRVEDPEHFCLYIVDGTIHGANIYFMPGGNLAYYDDSGWHTLCPFSTNTWYKIRMAISIPTNTYDIYVDDVLRARGAHFRGSGQVILLNRIVFGGNGLEKPVGYVDDLSLEAQVSVGPVETAIALTGGLDYLFNEDVKIRLDALVTDANTKATVSSANVNLSIYYPNGSLWVSDTMPEKLPGVYEWESNGTIHELDLEKGVYLAKAIASMNDDSPSTAILLFHVDPPPYAQATLALPEFYYIGLAASLVAAATASAILLRRHRRRL